MNSLSLMFLVKLAIEITFTLNIQLHLHWCLNQEGITAMRKWKKDVFWVYLALWEDIIFLIMANKTKPGRNT